MPALIPQYQTEPQRGSLRNWLCGWRSEAIFSGAVFAIFLILELYSAIHRPFWFDELSTLFISARPNTGNLLRALPTDGNPPLYFLLAHLCLRLPVSTELALRIPSILATTITAFTLYLFVRRRTRPAFALLAVSMFFGCAMVHYSIEARPYALLLCFTMLSLYSWQFAIAPAATKRNRLLALAAVAITTAGAVFAHNYGVIYVSAPILTGEFVRFFCKRKLDVPVLAALAIGSLALLVTYPPTLHAQRGLLAAIRSCPDFFGRPKWSSLAIYADMVPGIFPSVAAVVAFGVFLKYATFGWAKVASSRLDTSGMISAELAAAFTLALLLPIMLCATHFGTGYFMPRYAIGSSIGLAILSGFLFSFAARYRPWVRRLAVGMTAYGCLLGMFTLSNASRLSIIGEPRSEAMLQSVPKTEPIVIASALRFPPLWWYADAQLRPRLHYLSDISYDVRNSDMVPEYSLMLERAYTPMQMDNYKQFTTRHRSFYLFCYGRPKLEWIEPRLRREGWHFRLLQSSDDAKQDVHRRLYFVEAPANR